MEPLELECFFFVLGQFGQNVDVTFLLANNHGQSEMKPDSTFIKMQFNCSNMQDLNTVGNLISTLGFKTTVIVRSRGHINIYTVYAYYIALNHREYSEYFKRTIYVRNHMDTQRLLLRHNSELITNS